MSKHSSDLPEPARDAKEVPTPSLRPGPLPPYQLVLHRNDGNEMMRVVRTIMEITRFCVAEATQKMWEAHHYGRSKLLVTHKERAEFLAEVFGGRGLTVTVEPA